jgi:hypothetical protein
MFPVARYYGPVAAAENYDWAVLHAAVAAHWVVLAAAAEEVWDSDTWQHSVPHCQGKQDLWA